MQEAKLSVFSPAYWRTARAEFRNVRVLAFAGLVCAMAIVLEGLPIYLLGPSLKIYFSFLVVGLGCMCYGPCVGMMAGAIIDSVGFLLSSYGEPYFPGYLVTAVLSGLIYGVLLVAIMLSKTTVWIETRLGTALSGVKEKLTASHSGKGGEKA